MDIKLLNNIVIVRFLRLSNVDPLASNGHLGVYRTDDTTKQLIEDFVLPISRVQLEQDTAKSLRLTDSQSQSDTDPLNTILLDHNRSSIPLIEVVTPPVLRTPHHAATAFAKVAETLRAIGVTTADFHYGAMRCDVNVSLGLSFPRTEIKNLFGIRAVRLACEHEIEKQVLQWRQNEPIRPLTKTWDGTQTVETREKHGEIDYRYFFQKEMC